MREYMTLRSNYKKLEPQFITAKISTSKVLSQRGSQMIVDKRVGENASFQKDVKAAMCV